MANCSVCNIQITRKTDGGHRVDHAGKVIRYCCNCKGLKGGKGGTKVSRKYKHQSYGQTSTLPKTSKAFTLQDLQYLANMYFSSSSVWFKMASSRLVWSKGMGIEWETLDNEQRTTVIDTFELVMLKAVVLQMGTIKLDRKLFKDLMSTKQEIIIDTEHDKDVIEIKIKEITDETTSDREKESI